MGDLLPPASKAPCEEKKTPPCIPQEFMEALRTPRGIYGSVHKDGTQNLKNNLETKEMSFFNTQLEASVLAVSAPCLSWEGFCSLDQRNFCLN